LSDNNVPLTAQQQTQVNHNPNFEFQMPATFGNLILEKQKISGVPCHDWRSGTAKQSKSPRGNN
jgi:hypothetical protein